MLNFSFKSLEDMPPGESIRDRVAVAASIGCLQARFAVPIDELPGAAIGYSFRDIERLNNKAGSEWLATIFAGLDQKNVTVIRSMIEIGARGAAPDEVLEAVGLDRLSELIAAALLLRLKR
ncbi:hypothetical protein [Pararhizobium gei]|uniref:hypothetical protein n=1 Tax=Pararhizobium gei TaxID=1395951 RepID=UPI0023DAEC4A|nr:hypothetical protein [Rhizobium gei]